MKDITDTQENFKVVQERYKRTTIKRLRRSKQVNTPGDQVYLRVDREREKETRHKRAPIADGPFPVTKVENKSKTVVLESLDRTIENVSRN